MKLTEKWRVVKEVIDIPGIALGSGIYFTGVSTNLDLRLCMVLLLFAADIYHYTTKRSVGISLHNLPCPSYSRS